jgi:hypothetical protein
LIAGLGVLLWSRRSSAATTGSPRERPFVPPSEPPYGPARFAPLVERWRAEVAKRAQGLPVDAILEWIRIESGGDMCSIGMPSEVGIFQLMFPGDAKYGATLDGLRALCEKSKTQNPRDISWLSDDELDMQVGAGIRKMLASRDVVRRVFAQNGVRWPETSFDFGSAVKQIHATPAVISELVPKITRRDGAPPSSWSALRQKVMSFPADQMGQGLRSLWNAPSKHGLGNRLEDTLRNAEFVGRVWGSATAATDAVAVPPSIGEGQCGARAYYRVTEPVKNTLLAKLRAEGMSVTGDNPWDVDTKMHDVKLRAVWDARAKELKVVVTAGKGDFIATCNQIWGKIDPIVKEIIG